MQASPDFDPPEFNQSPEPSPTADTSWAEFIRTQVESRLVLIEAHISMSRHCLNLLDSLDPRNEDRRARRSEILEYLQRLQVNTENMRLSLHDPR